MSDDIIDSNITNIKDGEAISLEAAIAGAGINLLSINKISETHNDDNYDFVTVAVAFEFQWRSKGNYIWSKTCRLYTLSDLSSNFTDENDDSGLSIWQNDDLLPVTALDFQPMFDDIILKVMEARDQLESPDNRGRYAYAFIPDGAPKDIKERIWS